MYTSTYTQHVNLVAALNVGHNQAIIKEHVNVYRNTMYSQVGDLSILH
jgi:hypothetical protein